MTITHQVRHVYSTLEDAEPVPDDDILDADGWESTMDYTHDEWAAIQTIFGL